MSAFLRCLVVGYALLLEGGVQGQMILNSYAVQSITQPSAISGLVAWMRAEDLSGTLSDGDPVSTWTDRTGTGNATASSAARPTFRVAGLDGRPSLEYASGNSLTFARTVSGGNFTVFGYVKPDNFSVQRMWSHNSAGAAGTGTSLSISPSTGTIAAFGVSTAISSLDTVEINRGYVHALRVQSSASLRELLYNRTIVRSNNAGNYTYTVSHLGHASTYQWLGQFGEYILYNRRLTDTETGQVLAYLESKWGCLHNYILCAGDSLTYGSGASANHDYPSILRAAISDARYSVKNYGAPNQTIDNILTSLVANHDLYAPRIGTAGGKNIYVAFGGTNDNYFGASAATIESRLTTWCQGRQAAGFRVYVCTMIDRVPGGGTGGGWSKAVQTAVNTWIRANWATIADGLIDLEADTRFQTYSNTTIYNLDGTHLTDAGYAALGSLIQAGIGL